MTSAARSTEKLRSLALVPGVMWLVSFVAIPLMGTVALSFFTRDALGDPVPALSFNNFLRFIGFGAFGFNPIHLKIFGRTALLATIVTALAVIIALPLAFWIGSLSRPLRLLGVVVLTIPLWTNLLIRTYAWQIILSPNSALSNLAHWVGLIEQDEGLFPGYTATIVALVSDYLPFMALPLCAAVERIDWRIWEAALDLGARPIAAFRHGILPQITPSVAAGCTLVFIPALGQFVIPDLLGGSKAILIGNTISQQFGSSRDWPFGAALATVQIVVMLALISYVRSSDKRSV